MVFKFIQAIVFLTFYSVCVVYKSSMTLLLVVLALWNTRVYISSSDYSNMMAYVEEPVNETFCFCIILGISNVNPNHGYIRFGKNFNYSRVGC